MAITRYAGDRFVGLNEEKDSLLTKVMDGAIYITTDFDKQFIKKDGSWIRIGGICASGEVQNGMTTYDTGSECLLVESGIRFFGRTSDTGVADEGNYLIVSGNTSLGVYPEVDASGEPVDPQSVLRVIGDLRVEGDYGTLVEADSDITSSLFSVADSAGLPVFEVFPDDKIVGGRYDQSDFIIDSSGNVGIGVTGEILSKFHFDSASGKNDELLISAFEGQNAIVNISGTKVTAGPTGPIKTPIKWTISGDYANSGHLKIRTESGVFVTLTNESGYLGLGTEEPEHTLHVSGDAQISGYLYDIYNSTGQSGWVLTSESGGPVWRESSAGTIDGSGISGYLSVWEDQDTLGNSPVYQYGSNIGVDTTTIGAKLQVGGNNTLDTAILIDPVTGANNDRRWKFNAKSASDYLEIGSVSNTQIFVLDGANGSVGVGKIPQSGIKLDVEGFIQANKAVNFKNAVRTWQIQGDNAPDYLKFLDTTAGTLPMVIEGGASDYSVHIASGAKVGINTNTPQHAFHVNGDAMISGYLYDSLNTTGQDGWVLTSKSGGSQWQMIEDVLSGVGGSGTANYVPLWQDEDTIGNSIIYEDSGNIGIGTNDPQSKLQISKTSYGDLTLHRDANEGAGVELGEINFALNSSISSNQETWSKISAHTNSSNYRTDLRLYVKSTGGSLMQGLVVHGTASDGPYVGIGTAIPDRTLHILPNSDAPAIKVGHDGTQGHASLIEFDNGYTQKFYVGMSDTYASRDFVIAEVSLGSSTDATNPKYVFNGNGDGAFYITDAADNDIKVFLNTNGDSYLNGGNLGINVESPLHKFHVSGDAQISGYLYDYTNSTGQDGYVLTSRSGGPVWEEAGGGTLSGSGVANYSAKWDGETSLTSGIIYDDGTSVGIGTSTLSEALTVNGRVEADEFVGDLRGAVVFKANAGENISKGQAVYISGISGNKTVVSLADADDASKMPAFGVAAETVSANSDITIVTFGRINNLDTSSYTEGDELFVSTTAGALTDTPPAGESALLQKLAKVTRSDNSAGSMTVMGAGRTNAVPNLNEGRIFVGDSGNQAIADGTVYVDIANSKVGINTTSPQHNLHVSGDAIISGYLYDSTNSTGAAGYVLTSENNGPQWKLIEDVLSGVGGSGTTNYIAKWDDPDTLGDSVIAQSGNSIGIGTNTPQYKIDLYDATDSASKIGFHNATTGPNVGDGTRVGLNGAEFFINNQENGAIKIYTQSTQTNGITIDGLGKVGVGTTTPSQKLHVAGAIKSTTYFTSETAANAAYFDQDGTNARITSKGADDQTLGGFKVLQQASDGVPNNTPIEVQIDGDVLLAQSSGSVGIAENTPLARLHVGGDGKFDLADGEAVHLDGAGNTYFKIDKANATDEAIISFETAGSNNFNLGTAADTTKLYVSGNGFDLFTIQNQGNVGINTKYPEVGELATNNSNPVLTLNGGLPVINLNNSGIDFSTNPTEVSTLRYTVYDASVVGGTNVHGIEVASISAEYVGDGTEYNSDLVFSVASGDQTTSSVERARLTYQGQLKLNKYGNGSNLVGNANSHLAVDNDGNVIQVSSNGTTNFLPRYLDNYGALDDSVVQQDGNKIGINVAPEHQLHVSGDAIISGYLYDSTNSTGSAGYILSSEAGGPQWKQIEDVLSGVGGSGTANYVPLWQDEDTLTDSVIAQSGNYIGIGSDTPTAKLHVQDDSGLKVHATTPTDNAHYIRLRHNNSTGTIDANRGDLKLDAQNYVYTLKNFGINATTPSNKLVVINSDTDTTPTALLQNSSTGDASLHFNVSGRSYTIGIDNSDDDKFKIARNNGLGTTDRLTINGDGNIGIGTTSPTSLLHLRNPNADSDVGIKIGNDVRDWNLKVMGSASDSFQIFTHDDSNVFTILSDGKVGINTTTPTSLLHVHDGDILISNGDLQFYPDSSGAGSQFDYYAGKLFIGNQAGSSWHMVIQDDGNIGVGTTSPTSTLNISDSTAGASVLKVDGSSGTIFEVTDDLSNSLMSVNTIAGLPVFEVFADYHIVAGRYNQNDFYLSTGGNLGLGTATPSYKLDVSGGLRIYQDTTSSGVGVGLTVENDGTGDAIVQYLLTATRRWVTGIDNSDSDKFKIASSSDLGSDAHITIQTDGKVGIGTTAPSYPLDIEHDTAPTVSIVSVAADVSPRLIIDAGGGAGTADPHVKFDSNGVDWSVGVDQSDGDKFKFATSNGLASEKVVIQRDGNVGIGINDPESLFHVHSETNETTAIISSIVNSTTGSYLRLTEGGESFATYGYLGAYIQYDGANNLIHFGRHNVNGTSVSDDDPIITIKRDDGNLGINTIDPKHHLHVDGDAIISGYLYDSTNSTGVAGYVLASQAGGPQWQSIEDVLSGVGGGGTTNYIPKWDDPDTLGDSNIYEDSNGNIGINNATPSGHLDIGGVLNNPPTIRLTNKTNSVSQNDSLGEIQFFNSDDTDFTPGVFGIIRGVAHASGGEGSIQILTDMPSEGAPPTNVTAHFNSNGKVGIGTASPTLAQLHISGSGSGERDLLALQSTNNHAQLRIISESSTYSSYIKFQDNSGAAERYFIQADPSDNLLFRPQGTGTAANQVIFNSAGNIAVGRTAAGAKIDIATAANTNGFFIRDVSDQSITHNLYIDGNGNGVTAIYSDGQTGPNIQLNSAGVTFFNGGSVAIGHGSPATKLHVEASVTDNSSAEITRIQGTSSLTTTNTHLRFTSATSASNATNRWFGLQVYDHNPTTRALALQHSGGNVGIGTTSPQSSLHILGSTANNLRLERDATNDWQFLLTSGALVIQDATALTERLRIDSSGRLGVGITPITSNIGPAQANIQGKGIAVTRSTNDAYSNKLFFLKDRSTNYSNTIVQASDSLGEIIWAGADGVDYATWGASIEAVVDGTPGANDLPTRLVFSTTADGASFPTERMRITSAGQLLVGRTSALNTGSKLQVDNAIALGSSLYTFSQIIGGADLQLISNANPANIGTNSNIIFKLGTSGGGGPNEAMRITSAGNVGIGTDSPSNQLTLYKTSGNYFPVSLQANNIGTPGTYLGIQFGYTGGTYQKGAIIYESQDAYARGKMHFALDNGANAANAEIADSIMTVVSDGKVGIGTASPATTFHVNGQSFLIGANYGIYGNNDSTNYRLFDNASGQLVYNWYGAHIWQTAGGSERMRLNFDGNLGIGTTSPNQLLEVANSSGGATINISTDEQPGSIASPKYTNLDFSGYLNNVMARIQSWDESSSTGYGYLTFHTNTGAGLTEKLRIEHDGKVGIGVSPSYKLDVNGTVQIFNRSITNGYGLLVETEAYGMKIKTNADTNLKYNAFAHYWERLSNTYMVLNQSGNLRLNTYGLGNKSGTSAYYLTVDSSGNVIEELISSGTPTGSGTTNYIPKWDGAVSLTDSDIYEDNGNIGIGTTSPYAKLQVNGTTQTFNAHFGQGQNNSSGHWGGISLGYSENNNNYRKVGIVAKAIGDNAARQELHFLVDSVSDAGNATLTDSKMMIDISGNVGINTTDPDEKLHVVGNARIFSTGYPYIDLGITTSNYWRIINDNPNDALKIGKNGAADITITGGKVGIGTPSPTRKLHIDGGSASSTSIYIDANSINGTDIEQSANDFRFQVRDNIPLLFFTNNSEKVRIAADGNVGIGTTSPSSTLHVSDSTSGASVLKVDGSSGTIFEVTDDLSSSLMSVNTIAGLPAFEVFADYHIVAGRYNQNDFYLDTNGNLGLGTGSPASKLDVVGESTFAGKVNILTASTDGILRLGGGDGSSGNNNRVQMSFGYNGTLTYEHYIVTRHNAGTSDFNAFDFYTNDGTSSGTYPTNAVHNLTLNGGKVGIGTTSPSQALNIVRSDASGSAEFDLYSTNSLKQPMLTFRKSASNTIGTKSVTPDGSELGEIEFIGVNTGSNFAVKSVSILGLQDGAAGATYIPGALTFGTGTNAAAVSERMRIDSSGNVGIGTNNPTHRLTLGDISSSVATGRELVFYRQSNDISTGYDSTLAIYSKTNSFGTYEGAHFRARAFKFQRHDGSQEYLSINNDGNVGIGTADADYNLDIVGSGGTNDRVFIRVKSNASSGDGDAILYLDSAQTGESDIDFMHDGSLNWRIRTGDAAGSTNTNLNIQNASANNILTIEQVGYVGIGTDNPGTLLHVYQDSASSLEVLFENDGAGQSGLTLRSDRGSNGNLIGFVYFDGNDNGSNNTRYNSIESYIVDSSNGTEDGRLTFSSMVAGTDTEILHVTGYGGEGRVGIGTTSPSEKLEVNGNIKHQGLTMTSGTDIDQLSEFSQTLTIGTSWGDTGISSSNLATGTYIVQLFVNDYSVGGGQYSVYYSGTMSWYGSGTNDADFGSEIILHRAGHADNGKYVYLRTLSQASGVLKLQIAGNYTASGSSTYTFKFRRMI